MAPLGGAACSDGHYPYTQSGAHLNAKSFLETMILPTYYASTKEAPFQPQPIQYGVERVDCLHQEW